MKIREFLEKVYGVKKDNKLSHYAVNFVKKYNLDLDEEKTISELKDITILFSSLKVREKAIAILNSFVENVVETVKVTLTDLRTKTYKQIARILHPDSNGSESEFKVLQDIKESLWDYQGKPRKDIKNISWESEKNYHNNPMKGRGGFRNGL